tara:strand:+ start:536 stop:1090 length:555 start_codon:yes stop_codon:yes gene_type:complete
MSTDPSVRLLQNLLEKTAEMRLRGMSYDPNNKNILSLKKKYGSKWKSVLAEQRGIPESLIVEKTAAPTLESLQSQMDSLQHSMYGPPHTPSLPRHMQRAQIRRQSGFNAEAAVAKIERLGSKLNTLMAQQEQARQNIVFPAPTGDPSQDLMSSIGKNVALPAGVAALAAALVNNFTKKSSLKKN